MDPQWTVPKPLRDKVEAQFRRMTQASNTDRVQGGPARAVLLESRLPETILSRIWTLADADNDGALTLDEFVIALFLVERAKNGGPMPDRVPDALRISARGLPAQGAAGGMIAPGGPGAAPAMMAGQQMPMGPGPGPADWLITAADKAESDRVFQMYDGSRSGFLPGKAVAAAAVAAAVVVRQLGAQVAPILSSSGLPQPLLSQIWTLSDMSQRGALDPDEFAVARYLVTAAVRGYPPPPVLPPQLVPPSKRARAPPTPGYAAAFGTSPSATAPAAMAAAPSTNNLPTGDVEDRRRAADSRAREELEKRRKALMEEEERVFREAEAKRLEGDRKRLEEADRKRRLHEEEQMRQRAAAEQKRQEEARKARDRQLQQMQAELQSLARETEAQEALLAQLRVSHEQDATAIRELNDQTDARSRGEARVQSTRRAIESLISEADRLQTEQEALALRKAQATQQALHNATSLQGLMESAAQAKRHADLVGASKGRSPNQDSELALQAKGLTVQLASLSAERSQLEQRLAAERAALQELRARLAGNSGTGRAPDLLGAASGVGSSANFVTPPAAKPAPARSGLSSLDFFASAASPTSQAANRSDEGARRTSGAPNPFAKASSITAASFGDDFFKEAPAAPAAPASFGADFFKEVTSAPATTTAPSFGDDFFKEATPAPAAAAASFGDDFFKEATSAPAPSTTATAASFGDDFFKEATAGAPSFGNDFSKASTAASFTAASFGDDFFKDATVAPAATGSFGDDAFADATAAPAPTASFGDDFFNEPPTAAPATTASFGDDFFNEPPTAAPAPTASFGDDAFNAQASKPVAAATLSEAAADKPVAIKTGTLVDGSQTSTLAPVSSSSQAVAAASAAKPDALALNQGSEKTLNSAVQAKFEDLSFDDVPSARPADLSAKTSTGTGANDSLVNSVAVGASVASASAIAASSSSMSTTTAAFAFDTSNFDSSFPSSLTTTATNTTNSVAVLGGGSGFDDAFGGGSGAAFDDSFTGGDAAAAFGSAASVGFDDAGFGNPFGSADAAGQGQGQAPANAGVVFAGAGRASFDMAFADEAWARPPAPTAKSGLAAVAVFDSDFDVPPTVAGGASTVSAFDSDFDVPVVQAVSAAAFDDDEFETVQTTAPTASFDDDFDDVAAPPLPPVSVAAAAAAAAAAAGSEDHLAGAGAAPTAKSAKVRKSSDKAADSGAAPTKPSRKSVDKTAEGSTTKPARKSSDKSAQDSAPAKTADAAPAPAVDEATSKPTKKKAVPPVVGPSPAAAAAAAAAAEAATATSTQASTAPPPAAAADGDAKKAPSKLKKAKRDSVDGISDVDAAAPAAKPKVPKKKDSATTAAGVGAPAGASPAGWVAVDSDASPFGETGNWAASATASVVTQGDFDDAFGSAFGPAASAGGDAAASGFADAWGASDAFAAPAPASAKPAPPPVSKSPAALAAEASKPRPPPVGPSPAARASANATAATASAGAVGATANALVPTVALNRDGRPPPTVQAAADRQRRRLTSPGAASVHRDGLSMASSLDSVALFEAPVREPGDVHLYAGDMVTVTTRHGDGWASGVVWSHGGRGMFPEDYVESATEANVRAWEDFSRSPVGMARARADGRARWEAVVATLKSKEPSQLEALRHPDRYLVFEGPAELISASNKKNVPSTLFLLDDRLVTANPPGDGGFQEVRQVHAVSTLAASDSGAADSKMLKIRLPTATVSVSVPSVREKALWLARLQQVGVQLTPLE